MSTPRHIRLGSRGSALALWQTEHVAAQLRALYPDLAIEKVVIQTKGDRVLDKPLPSIGGKGLFTLELEEMLLSGGIDAAVHSLKDLPAADPEGLALGAIPARGDVSDAIVVRNEEVRQHTALVLKEGAVVGTGSVRRAAQLLALRPDLSIRGIRGNVDTRVRKALDPEGPYDAVVLASAGLNRLGLDEHITLTLPLEQMLPAPGQGALAVQCRRDPEWLDLFGPIENNDTRVAVTAERAFLAGLGGGCRAPIAALGELAPPNASVGSASQTVEAENLCLRGRVSAPDGSRQVDVQMTAPRDEAEQLGRDLAQWALREGAQEIIDLIYQNEGPPSAGPQ